MTNWLPNSPPFAAPSHGDQEMTELERQRLADAQAELLRAVLADGPTPAGFDALRLHAQANALRAKRRRVVAALRPDLPANLGDRFGPLFDEYAHTNPRREGVTARDDAAAFARWLIERDEFQPSRQRRWWPWRGRRHEQ